MIWLGPPGYARIFFLNSRSLNLIVFAKSLLPHKVKFLQVLRIRMRVSLGGCYSVYHEDLRNRFSLERCFSIPEMGSRWPKISNKVMGQMDWLWKYFESSADSTWVTDWLWRVWDRKHSNIIKISMFSHWMWSFSSRNRTMGKRTSLRKHNYNLGPEKWIRRQEAW